MSRIESQAKEDYRLPPEEERSRYLAILEASLRQRPEVSQLGQGAVSENLKAIQRSRLAVTRHPF